MIEHPHGISPLECPAQTMILTICDNSSARWRKFIQDSFETTWNLGVRPQSRRDKSIKTATTNTLS
jgi:hypothetical protein